MKPISQLASPKKPSTKLTLGVAAGVFLSACGAIDPGYVDHNTPRGGSGNYYLNDSSSVSDGAYNCPTSPNVLPHQDVTFDGTQRYTVCKNGASATRILVKGFSSTSDTVCVYPIQYVDATRFVYKLTPSGLPLFACGNLATNHRMEFDFANTNYNALIVVDSADQLNMSRCLTMGQTCPNYSMGRL